MIQLANALVLACEIYAAIGVVFAIAFVVAGVGAVDPGAKGAPLGFRFVVLPASAVLWPWLAWRWARRIPPREEHNAHRDAARRRALGDGEAP